MKTFLRNHAKFILLLGGFLLFRASVADWNPVPSGSMRPTILEGDVIFINRLAYDLKVPLSTTSVLRTGEPQRGDVVTFKSPQGGILLVKRLEGLPGDVIFMRDKKLFINGEPKSYTITDNVIEGAPNQQSVPTARLTETNKDNQHAVQWTSATTGADTFGPITVPANQYFMLGDNRDNSNDSRFIGFVPRELLVGHAVRILVSADILTNWMPRWERFGKKL